VLLIDQYAHFLYDVPIASQLDYFLRCVLHAVGHGEIQAGFQQNLAAQFDIGAFHADHDGHLNTQVRAAAAPRRWPARIAAQNAAENIDQYCLHGLIGEQDAEGVFDLLGIRAAADVQKIGRTSAGVFHDIHGAHGEAGAVHHAGHVAVELDVVETEFGGLHFERIFLIEVAQLGQILVTEHRVVVEDSSWRRARRLCRPWW
jgi:hypothetical protein